MENDYDHSRPHKHMSRSRAEKTAAEIAKRQRGGGFGDQKPRPTKRRGEAQEAYDSVPEAKSVDAVPKNDGSAK